jgi:predicted secreted protein
MVSVGGAAPIMLPALPSDFEMAWGDGVRRLTFDGGSASYDAGGGAALLVCRAVDRGLPPPAAPNVVRQLGADDDGATVELKVGERFSVALSGVPTAGYLWAVENPPPFLRLAEELGGATSSSQFLPGFTGGNHWSVLVIEATAAGEGDLKLAQRRPWEDVSEPDAGAFTVRVKATN